MFQSYGRKNYAIEILQFLLHHDYLLSEREAAEVLWSRFINVHRRPGKNIPNDLHCEHLNQLCKTAVKWFGQQNEGVHLQDSKAIGTVSPVIDTFDEDNGVSSCSAHHNLPSSRKDMSIIITECICL